MSSLALVRPGALPLPALFQTMPERGRRFWEFFTVNIRNPNSRRAYFKAVEGFRKHQSFWSERQFFGCNGPRTIKILCFLAH